MKIRFVVAVVVAVVLAGTIGFAQQSAVHSATGHGSMSEDNNGVLYWDEWSFSAIQRANGSVSGQLQYHDHEADFSFHASVIDLKVEGNWAKLSAALPEGWQCPEEACQPDYFPTLAVVVAVDNGQGRNGPDQISWGYLVDPAFYSVQDFIDMTPREFVQWLSDSGHQPPLFDYIHGNIQVR